MRKTIISVQNEAIDSLKKAINSFVESKRIKTRVIPLAIPTGWGKTRIAIQGILKANKKKYNPFNVIIWPQKQSHISDEVWLRCSDWCNKRDKSKCQTEICERNVMPSIKYLHSSKKGPKSNRHERGAGKHSKKFDGTFYYVNNNFRKGIVNQLDRNNGPIIFIIDEWHTKKFIEKYEASKIGAERFWRNLLIGKENKRKLFVVLISATPIGATSQMDSICAQEDDVKYEKDIKNALQLFSELTIVGNQKREYNLYKIYPDLIKREENKLENNSAKFGHKSKNHKSDWACEYIRLSKICYSNNSQMPHPPSLVYPLESLMHSGTTYDVIESKFSSLRKYFTNRCLKQHETLKLKTTKELINRYADKKFVIFCHYIAVAHSLNNYLSKQNIPCYFLQGDVKKSDTKFNSFNDDNGKIRILIVTDEHSQGISLHKSKAWLLHFELSWNPIRIIQRYGRVWRIDKKTKRLTLPVAFHIPHSFSSEEEQVARLKRRWQVLSQLPKEEETFVKLAPISFKVALGIRCTPLPCDYAFYIQN